MVRAIENAQIYFLAKQREEGTPIEFKILDFLTLCKTALAWRGGTLRFI